MKNRRIFYFLTGAGILLIVIILIIYTNLFGAGIIAGNNYQVIYIPTGSSYYQVLDTLESKLIIKNRKVLEWVARKKSYPDHIKPGQYVISTGLSYNGLITLLRSGRQSPRLVLSWKAKNAWRNR